MAGQRVQIIKRSKEGGRLQLGTEVVAASDGSLAALLGASPGASTAVTIMLEVLQRCFPERLASAEWQERLLALAAQLLQRSKERSGCIEGECGSAATACWTSAADDFLGRYGLRFTSTTPCCDQSDVAR